MIIKEFISEEVNQNLRCFKKLYSLSDRELEELAIRFSISIKALIRVVWVKLQLTKDIILVLFANGVFILKTPLNSSLLYNIRSSYT